MGVMRPDLIMRSIIPVVMAGVVGIYGLITAVIINGKLDPPDQYSQYSGYAHLGAGLTVGMILILIFAEALGLYGLIVGLVVASTATVKGTDLCTRDLRNAVTPQMYRGNPAEWQKLIDNNVKS